MKKSKSGGAPYVKGHGSLPTLTPKAHGSVIDANSHAIHIAAAGGAMKTVSKMVSGALEQHYGHITSRVREAIGAQPGIAHGKHKVAHVTTSPGSSHGKNPKLKKLRF